MTHDNREEELAIPTHIRRILESFKDKESRDSYAQGFLWSTIATQIKVLREQRGWTQEELAVRAGLMQSRISQVEDVNYERWSINGLLKLARAFDVRLKVTFEPFSTLPEELSRFSRESLQVEPYDQA